MVQFLSVSTLRKLYKISWYDNWATAWTTENYWFDSLQRKEIFHFSHGVVKMPCGLVERYQTFLEKPAAAVLRVHVTICFECLKKTGKEIR